jgi:hypothetical protein
MALTEMTDIAAATMAPRRLGLGDEAEDATAPGIPAEPGGGGGAVGIGMRGPL